MLMLDYQKLKKMSAQDIKDLIQDVLHKKEFNSNEVDNNMHKRLMRAVSDCTRYPGSSFTSFYEACMESIYFQPPFTLTRRSCVILPCTIRQTAQW
jgi:hypothetical protein